MLMGRIGLMESSKQATDYEIFKIALFTDNALTWLAPFYLQI